MSEWHLSAPSAPRPLKQASPISLPPLEIGLREGPTAQVTGHRLRVYMTGVNLLYTVWEMLQGIFATLLGSR